MTVGVADTNCLVLLDRLDPVVLPDRLVTSSISLAELAAGPALAGDPREAALRQIRLQQVLRTVEVLPFDEDAAMAFAAVAASRRQLGRKVAARYGDDIESLDPHDWSSAPERSTMGRTGSAHPERRPVGPSPRKAVRSVLRVTRFVAAQPRLVTSRGGCARA